MEKKWKSLLDLPNLRDREGTPSSFDPIIFALRDPRSEDQKEKDMKLVEWYIEKIGNCSTINQLNLVASRMLQEKGFSDEALVQMVHVWREAMVVRKEIVCDCREDPDGFKHDCVVCNNSKDAEWVVGPGDVKRK